MMLTSSDTQTIVAQCTPRGVGALALLRISGPDAVPMVSAIASLASGESLEAKQSHTIHYGKIVDVTGTSIDHVLFFLMRGPKTFTGQDTVEISCHNNQFIIEAIIARIIKEGARIARNGEFSQRAVLNNKIDILQAEAIQELLTANNQYALKKSLAQLDGSLSQVVCRLEESLIKALALSEASFEFLDEEYLEFSAQIKTCIVETLETIENLRGQFDHQQQIRQGFKIAVIGSVNAGKSSLFNALIGSNRAIVSPVAGTTRDSIEAGLYKQGVYWTMIDTAGLRSTDDAIEQEGIDRSFKQAHQADLIILAIDSSRGLTPSETVTYRTVLEQYESKTIPVCTKADLPQMESGITITTQSVMRVSSNTGLGIDILETRIEDTLARLNAQQETPFLLNIRQYNLLLELERELCQVIPLLDRIRIPFEIITLHLREAIAQLSQLTGKTISESAMDAVFKTFCVGK